MVDLSDKANDMQAGKYELSQNMTLNEIIDELMTGQVSVTTVLATIREGRYSKNSISFSKRI